MLLIIINFLSRFLIYSGYKNTATVVLNTNYLFKRIENRHEIIKRYCLMDTLYLVHTST